MPKPVASLTSRFVANALGLSAPAEQKTFTGITSDTRGDIAGSLFVAIVGERFDGHDFVRAAIEAGAAAVLVERGRLDDAMDDVVVFSVDDTVAAWRRIAGRWRRRFDGPVIAIAGSAGKTTTKNLLAAMLRGKYSDVLSTQGSRNGYLGLAMTLSALRPEHRAAVVEIGIDAPGAMAEHARLVQPDASLVTMVGAEHLDTLHDVATVAAEEGRLLEWTASKGGALFIHDHDSWLAPYLERFSAVPCIRYGLGNQHGDRRALRGRIAGRELLLNGLGVRDECVPLPLIGRHNALNVLAAATVALHWGVTLRQIRAALADFNPDAARSNVVRWPNGALVLADYYNASPVSVVAALEALTEIDAERRWLCLADMLDLGPGELAWHRELAGPVIAARPCGVFLYGTRMKALADALRRNGYEGEVRHFDNKPMLAETLRTRLGTGDAVLIKGSRSMAMEDVM